MKLPQLFLISAVFLGALPLYGLDGWMTDLPKARRQATEQHKDLFIVYQGGSWNPEKYGTPESMFTCGSVKKYLGARFVLVLQEYPPHFSGNETFFTFNINIYGGGLNFSFFPERENRFTRYVFATADHVPYYVTEQKSSWLDLKAEIRAAEKKKVTALSLIRKIQATRGNKKYGLIGRLFYLTRWEPKLPASLYPRLYQETLRNDHDNLSGISHKNYLRQMQEMVHMVFWWLEGFKFTAPETGEISQEVRSHLDAEAIQTLAFIKLGIKQGSSLMNETLHPGELKDFLAFCQKKTEQILAQAPSSIIAYKIKIQSHVFFPRIYYFAKLTSTPPDPLKNLDLLPSILNQPWVDEETEQLFRFIESACYLKLGNLDKGLELMKESRDIAPWTNNASEANASVQSISRQLPALHRLWEKKQSGDQEAAKAYQEGIRITPSVIFHVSP